MKDTQNIIAIKSIFELDRGFENLDYFLNKLSDVYLKNKIVNEIKRKNSGNIIFIIDKYLFKNIKNPLMYNENDIKIFDFEDLECVTIEEIKVKLEINKFNFNTAKNTEGNETNLFRHWDNTNRFAVLAKKDLVYAIKNNPEIKLNLSKTIITAKLGCYTSFTIDKWSVSENSYDDDYGRRSYSEYNGAYGYDDDTINSAFDGDPENYWNID